MERRGNDFIIFFGDLQLWIDALNEKRAVKARAFSLQFFIIGLKTPRRLAADIPITKINRRKTAGREGEMNFGAYFKKLLGARIPIITDLYSASWPNWREALKEIFVILFFSLMPLWLGLLIVNLLTITDGASNFVTKFASSSDLGILSASLLGPMLYMMFREDNERTGDRLTPGFPSGLWFIMFTVACCMVATAIYCFTYLSSIHAFFDNKGSIITFINSNTVAYASWWLFGVVVWLILCASTIRNSIETQPPFMMSADTQFYVEKLQAAQEETQ